jgi:hypothetical protein
MQVYLLTQEQAEMLIGVEFVPDNYFNPIQDFQDSWVISIEEIILCNNPQFLWVKDLPLIDYQPKPSSFRII